MKEKGLTLIEVLGAIILLGLIALIIFPNIESALKSGKTGADSKIAENVVLSARSWAVDNKKQLPETDLKTSVDLATLQAGGYIEKPVKKPSTGDLITEACVIITNKNDVYYYEYDETCANRPIYSKVTYDYKTNGGTSTTAKNQDKVLSGTKVNLSATATKSGYTFVGWNTNKNAHTALTSFSMPADDVTLYAIYKKLGPSYVLSTSANGGSGTSASSTCTIPTVYNNEVQATSCTAVLPRNTFTRSGYSFEGWGATSTTTSTYNPGTSISLSSNRTFYAIWSRTLVATFKNGSTTYTTRSCTSVNGNSCAITLPAGPSKSGYTFRGWSLSSSASSGTSAYNVVYISANTTYYATFTKNEIIPTCSITASGNSKAAANTGIIWYYSGNPAVTLDTNGTVNTFTGPNGESLSKTTKKATLTYDIEYGQYYASVKSSTGNTKSCSYYIRRDTTAPKTYIALNEWGNTVNDDFGNPIYAEVGISVNSNLNGGTLPLAKTGYRISTIDYIYPYANGSGDAARTGGYGSGLRSPVVMVFDGAGSSKNITSPSSYDRGYGVTNRAGSFRIDHRAAFTVGQSRSIRFTVTDNLGHSRTATITVFLN